LWSWLSRSCRSHCALLASDPTTKPAPTQAVAQLPTVDVPGCEIRHRPRTVAQPEDLHGSWPAATATQLPCAGQQGDAIKDVTGAIARAPSSQANRSGRFPPP